MKPNPSKANPSFIKNKPKSQKVSNVVSSTTELWPSKQNILPPTKTSLLIQLKECNLPFNQSQLANLLKLNSLTGANDQKKLVVLQNNLFYKKLDNGSFYYGYTNNNKNHGIGFFKYPDNTTDNTKRYYYVGNYQNDKFHGFGKLIVLFNRQTVEGRVIYQGFFNNGFKQGQGTYFYIKQQMKNCYYHGQWKQGKRNGFGIQYLQGIFYQGQWQNNTKKGKGKLTIDKQNIKIIYQGIWDDSQIQKDGVITYFDVKNGKKIGSYRGQIFQGLRDGNGNLIIDPKVLKVQGQFVQDNIKQATMETSNFIIKGNFVNSYPEGRLNGKIFYPSGDYFQGVIIGQDKCLIPQYGKFTKVDKADNQNQIGQVQGNMATGRGQFLFFNKNGTIDKVSIQ